ncbi:ABC transporter ATP-binding protein/permease [Clostridium estertheticum]|uniref:ABC transporter ATP-binding protein n=1 Tax=Clostridium estertheticum TaxID=238834 RepID=UPI001CF2C3C5|nr:ABC transporter ATP-binding protein [Clostridium estertheticum]MCB2307968.1 ABC transporter ATP-binding protein/permease [Clostridium estertheticum]MCB2346092.1 ABC transporter ATP-binding protein/permease [Clostridium estertheticum]MCB2351350.1 ABC transporter ATP-binding protein/permease [Clostridium estertheticum]WAG44235.1 ABC transporter ATP-binding protein/permease [Clostridium estertheticum]
MYKLLKFLKPYRKECILGPTFKLIEALLELLLPTLMALIINNGVSSHDTSYVLKMGGIMCSMAILGFCSSMTCQYFAALTSQGFGTTLRNKLFEHISTFSYVEIDKFGAASLTNRITSDVNQLQLAVAMLIRMAFRAPFICIGAIIMSMLLDIRLALVLIIATPIFGIIIYLIISRTSPLYRKYQNKLDRLGTVVRENLSGARVIRAFAKTKNEEKRFKATNDDLTSTAVLVGKTSALLNPLTTLVMNVAIIAILWASSYHINAGTLSQGTIIAFVNYATQILVALVALSNLVIIFTKAFASASRVNEILDTVTSIKENGNNVETSSRGDDVLIEFKQVSFAYDSASDCELTDINITINKGETVGIIGATGSGKSTFVNLIPRFYDVSKGEIVIKGINVKDYSLKKLREKISMVPQKSVLFTGTISDNIRWGKKTATREEIIDAAKTAQANEFIKELPDGYNTQVTRGGLNFSGGQKQRLTIARAIIAKPEILILDDSSSALDFSTDAALRTGLKSLSDTMTVITVSQRASSIKHVDKIIVFDDGKIVGVGPHEHLMTNCETYKDICLSQLSEKEVNK